MPVLIALPTVEGLVLGSDSLVVATDGTVLDRGSSPWVKEVDGWSLGLHASIQLLEVVRTFRFEPVGEYDPDGQVANLADQLRAHVLGFDPHRRQCLELGAVVFAHPVHGIWSAGADLIPVRIHDTGFGFCTGTGAEFARGSLFTSLTGYSPTQINSEIAWEAIDVAIKAAARFDTGTGQRAFTEARFRSRDPAPREEPFPQKELVS